VLQTEILPKQCFKDSNNKTVIPDGVTKDGEPVEGKCPRPRDGESSLSDMAETRKNFPITKDGKINKKSSASDQIQKQIHATGKEKGYLAVHYNDNKGKEETKVVTVQRDQERIDKLRTNDTRRKERKMKEKEEKKNKAAAEDDLPDLMGDLDIDDE